MLKSSRKDGVRTQMRLLEVACEIFADRGFRDTTVAEICERAEANVAAVNYHFGSKDVLYASAWRHAFEASLRVYPADGGVPPEAPPEERLRGRIAAFLRRIFDDGRVGQSVRLLLGEMANPTEVIENVRHDVIRPLRKQMCALVGELLGPKASEQDVLFCEMSVVNQCLASAFLKRHRRHFLGRKRFTAAEVESLVDHITRFSLAGIQATGARPVQRRR